MLYAQPPSPVESAIQSQLDEAIAQVNEGALQQAREKLQNLADRVQSGDPVPLDIRSTIFVYLGEVQYLLHDSIAARASFRHVLLEDPDYVMSPYQHGEDIRAYFALVQADVRTELASVEEPSAPVFTPVNLPFWGYAPLGIPQFAQRRPVAGAVLGGLQIGFGAGSLITFGYLTELNQKPNDAATQEDLRRRVTQYRNFLQIPLTTAFHATWAISAFDAGAHWEGGKHQHVQSAVLITPNGLLLVGAF